ncbi:MAG TPA: hypothetical protein VNO32_04920 [Candidatus Acidoferrum sp.]|nr:hypothetical protein [Candidatus Acidoferrum sp.]
MPRESLAEAECTRAYSDELYIRVTLARIKALTGNLAEARETLNEVEHVEQVAKAPFSRALWCAMIHSLLGEQDQAFAWLDKPYEAREPALTYLNLFVDFNSLQKTSASPTSSAESACRRDSRLPRKWSWYSSSRAVSGSGYGPSQLAAAIQLLRSFTTAP